MTQPTPPPTPPTDDQLLRRFIAGDRAAFEELARRYEPILAGLVRGICSDADLARDALQETWVRIIRHAPRFRFDCAVKTWVYRIAINRARDLRAASRRGPTPNSALASEALDDAPTDPPAPHAASQHADDTALVRAALDHLPEDDRLILLLCYHHALKQQDAAEVLGIPLGTLKTRHRAALARLRAALGGKAHA